MRRGRLLIPARLIPARTTRQAGIRCSVLGRISGGSTPGQPWRAYCSLRQTQPTRETFEILLLSSREPFVVSHTAVMEKDEVGADDVHPQAPERADSLNRLGQPVPPDVVATFGALSTCPGR
jgi:hypothetical protein